MYRVLRGMSNDDDQRLPGYPPSSGSIATLTLRNGTRLEEQSQHRRVGIGPVREENLPPSRRAFMDVRQSLQAAGAEARPACSAPPRGPHATAGRCALASRRGASM